MSSALLTLREVLAHPAVAAGRPEVLTGSIGLDRPVRWIHVSELPDIADLLDGGELLLTTGVGLPTDGEALERYATALAGARVVGLVVELGRRFDQLPRSLVRAAREHRLPLVALHKEVRFVSITEAVNGLIVEAKVEELRTAAKADEVFTELNLADASAQEIVTSAAALVGAATVLEDLRHHVLAADTYGRPVVDVLDRWEVRSRRVLTMATAEAAGPEQWLVTTVGAQGHVWGRLVSLVEGPPTPAQPIVLERAASALALSNLQGHDPDELERDAHHGFLADLLRPRADPEYLLVRARSLGLVVDGRPLAGLVVRFQPDDDGSRDGVRADVAARVARMNGLPCAVAPVQTAELGLLVLLPHEADRQHVLRRLSGELCRRLTRLGEPRPLIAAGETATDLQEARRSLTQAREVADAFTGSVETPKPYVELADVGLRGVLNLLQDQASLQAFVSRELGPLLGHDARNGTDLLGCLRTYLEHDRDKTRAAQAYNVSRATFYRRLATIERVLDVRLDSFATSAALYTALLAHRR